MAANRNILSRLKDYRNLGFSGKLLNFIADLIIWDPAERTSARHCLNNRLFKHHLDISVRLNRAAKRKWAEIPQPLGLKWDADGKVIAYDSLINQFDNNGNFIYMDADKCDTLSGPILPQSVPRRILAKSLQLAMWLL